MNALREVLADDTCSGCGACVLAGAADRMALDARGHLRPIPHDPPGGPPLETYCPALTVDRPTAPDGADIDPFFGASLDTMRAHAADDGLRYAGSSGGVISALVATALDSGLASRAVVAVGEDSGTRSTSTVLSDGGSVLNSASSRYAPLSTLAEFADQGGQSNDVLVCRPCEAAAARRLLGEESRPLLLSFFCAGVPSQAATDDLIRAQGINPEDVRSLRYRGNGWPGMFVVETRDGRQFRATYEQSWGEHLGRRLQNRCKVCVDGVGEAADVSVGDLWEVDDNGYPLFAESPGESALLVRTARGSALVTRAIVSGAVEVEPTDWDSLRAAQPLQVNRRRFLLARLIGQRLAKVRVPGYRGFGLVRLALSKPRESLRQLRGSYQRAKRQRMARVDGS